MKPGNVILTCVSVVVAVMSHSAAGMRTRVQKRVHSTVKRMAKRQTAGLPLLWEASETGPLNRHSSAGTTLAAEPAGPCFRSHCPIV